MVLLRRPSAGGRSLPWSRQTSTYRAPSAAASVRCAGATPTSTDRDGSTPLARANARGSPGSGGRHQQLGGPAGWAHSAASTRPETSAARPATAGASASTSPPGRQSNSRCGAARSPDRARRRPALGGQGGRGDEHAGRPGGRARRPREGHLLEDGPSLVVRRRLELAARTHLRRGREHPVPAPGQDAAAPRASEASRARSSRRSTRLTCAWASGVSSQTHRTASAVAAARRRSRGFASRASGRCCRGRPAGRPTRPARRARRRGPAAIPRARRGSVARSRARRSPRRRGSSRLRGCP